MQIPILQVYIRKFWKKKKKTRCKKRKCKSQRLLVRVSLSRRELLPVQRAGASAPELLPPFAAWPTTTRRSFKVRKCLVQGDLTEYVCKSVHGGGLFQIADTKLKLRTPKSERREDNRKRRTPIYSRNKMPLKPGIKLTPSGC